MSYVPAANEYAISPITAGFPATTAAYLRCYSNRLVPGVSAELTGQLLDANGNVLAGGTFSNTYAAVFAATDAANMSVRSLMFFDTNSGQGVFTYLLNAAVLKDSVHSMTVVLVKSWNRNLS